ncbi:MAG: undecaprenyldiphospho-muramoylpentapeptide beta-N-acetylglucosaminyltransferase [Cyanobacteria bacterium SIG31]|nr:undecaprenyldiphospho-muramoylpentapeptide beta-N-acetylglucosaminyltransferase [Cyanobacteria bacterium SIG31]
MSETYKKVYFVTGGGTGGHIYPAMAVADALSEENKVYYVGNKRNMEHSLALQKGYKFLHVGVSGMPRKLNPKFFYWGIKLVRAILYSVAYIKKYKPTAVFATGGYVSAPMIFACIITKTPYMMHDCDAMPGLVTRRLCKRARFVSLAFERAKRYIPSKHVLVTGNPIRKEFHNLTKEQAKANMGLKDKITLTVMGGSQGAKAINNTAVEVLKEFVQEHKIQVVFQTGKRNYDEIIEKLKLFYPNWEKEGGLVVKPYFDDMVSVLKSSDIVVSRAGSLSLSEICASGIAPILVPYPYAAANHQRINAKCVQQMGACVYVEEKDFEPNKLREIILGFLNNPIRIDYLKQNTSYLAKFDATEKIVEALKSI